MPAGGSSMDVVADSAAWYGGIIAAMIQVRRQTKASSDHAP
jgi:hypothetical protein